MQVIIILAVLLSTYMMVAAKRVPALLRGFRNQSFFLFVITAMLGYSRKHTELYFVAGLILILKVIVIPRFLELTAKRIKVDENLGLFLNPQLSLLAAFALTYFSWSLSRDLAFADKTIMIYSTVSLSMVFIGALLMICRMKAFTQVSGLLVMENGVFLFAASIAGGVPFIIEIAVFFDVFVSVLVMGLFVYRINKLFTHIDISKLSQLRG